MTETNPVVIAGIAIMVFGAATTMGIFRRFGPIETPRGMTRLGWTIITIGFLVALSQSTPA